MNVFAKIFAQIFDSSISADYVVRHVFMDLLVLADRDGVVDMTLDAISRRTNVPEEMIAHAITELMRPDRRSRSHTEDGARLVAIDSHRDWGWQIVNYEHYRNIKDEEARRTYFRDKQREFRASRSKGVKDSQKVSKEITQGEEEGEGEREIRPSPKPPPAEMDTTDTRILSESVGIFGMREQADMNRLLAVYLKDSGKSVADAIETMTARWKEYQEATPMLEWAYGSSYKFFLSGNWDKPETWPKIGAKPTAREVRMNAWKADLDE